MCRVVSFPAVVRRMKIVPNSCSVSREPSISASTSFVVMSSRGSCAPRLAEPAAVLDQVERERARERQHAELRVAQRALDDVLLADDVRVGVAEDLVAELDDQPPVVDRQAHDLGEDPHRDLGGDVLDPVERVLLERLREDPPGETADPLLVRVDHARREALVDERAHPRVRRRIGVEHRLPRLELLVGQVLERRPAELARERLPVLRDRDDVVVAGEDPEAAPVDLGLPEDRGVTAQEREPVVGHALLPGVEVGEVDVVERQAVERRRRDRDRARLRLGHVVVAGVRGLLGVRRRREPHVERAGVLARLVDRKRLEGGRGQHVARAYVELRAVARAHDDGPVELAVGERALLVRAGVVERDPRAAEATDADGAPADLDAPEVPLRRVAGRPDVVPRLFRSLLRWTVVERLVERRHAVVLGRVRGSVVDLTRAGSRGGSRTR